ncbi:uncharacterized protein MAM_00533 [Metarhizium album ARSEF 1941]|uniref:Uncharacterized protein n=1 Tax=Metarhizium album (strain ARSEF 1941) TaxID=1081103 RepID=A0A0B2WZ04_METAS|nr:uncharacterized protein MAM_00533 [Metarhizium album ARSEF 1941]KHO01532.1 hypothetical protein MAM_00533 [Metarhizium album ARSEF 1941]
MGGTRSASTRFLAAAAGSVVRPVLYEEVCLISMITSSENSISCTELTSRNNEIVLVGSGMFNERRRVQGEFKPKGQKGCLYSNSDLLLSVQHQETLVTLCIVSNA